LARCADGGGRESLERDRRDEDDSDDALNILDHAHAESEPEADDDAE